MATTVKRARAAIATINCSLITVETTDGVTPVNFGFDTVNQIQVESQISERAGVTLVVKDILRAQDLPASTITGHQITLTDNLFSPDLVKLLQGGEIVYDTTEPEKIIGYNPPVAGSSEKGEAFTLHAYSAVKDAAGNTLKYEKISYPNCQGVPVAFGSEDGAFRVAEYIINSAPKTGEPPYKIEYVAALPELVDA